MTDIKVLTFNLPDTYLKRVNELTQSNFTPYHSLLMCAFAHQLRNLVGYRTDFVAQCRRFYDHGRLSFSKASLMATWCPYFSLRKARYRLKGFFHQMEKFGFIKELSTEGHDLSFEVTDLMLELTVTQQGEHFCPITIALLTDPQQLLGREKRLELLKAYKSQYTTSEEQEQALNRYIDSRLSGSALVLLCQFMIIAFNGGKQAEGSVLDVVLDLQDRAGSQRCGIFRNFKRQAVSDAGLSADFTNERDQATKLNTEQHRFNEALSVLQELGFLDVDFALSKSLKRMYAKCITLASGIFSKMRQMFSKRMEQLLAAKQHFDVIKNKRNKFKVPTAKKSALQEVDKNGVSIPIAASSGALYTAESLAHPLY